MNKITRFLPHNLITLRGLAVFFRLALYLLLAVTVYSLVNAVSVWTMSAQELVVYSAPLKQLWGTILLQEVLLFISLSLLLRVCTALHAVAARELMHKD